MATGAQWLSNGFPTKANETKRTLYKIKKTRCFWCFINQTKANGCPTVFQQVCRSANMKLVDPAICDLINWETPLWIWKCSWHEDVGDAERIPWDTSACLNEKSWRFTTHVCSNVRQTVRTPTCLHRHRNGYIILDGFRHLKSYNSRIIICLAEMESQAWILFLRLGLHTHI